MSLAGLNSERVPNPPEEKKAAKPLPQYRSHKVVGALKIKMIEFLGVDCSHSHQAVFEEDGFDPLPLTHDEVYTKKFAAGGYLVVYEDGYRSFSPAKAFEEGYTKIEG